MNKADMTTYLCVKLKVQDAKTGAVLFEIQTHASDRMRWSVTWLNEKAFQLTSSDIGNYCWAEADDGNWQSMDCPP